MNFRFSHELLTMCYYSLLLGTYEESVAKLKQLETEEHALTLESEDSAFEAQRQLTLAVKRQKLEAKVSKFHDIFLSENNDTKVAITEEPITDTPDDTEPGKKIYRFMNVFND